MSNSSKPKIFISYSWDSDEYRVKVEEFVDKLNTFNIFEISFDGYLQSTPTGGLKSWMQNKVQEVNFVLIVCSENYFNRFENNVEPKEGRGVK